MQRSKPMLREYIISEAMHALRIPTTRSLAVVTTGEVVIRETELPGAILTRVAASHLRVGTFQYAARFLSKDELQALADYAMKRHDLNGEQASNRYLFLLEEVMKKQAALVAKWQLVGFIHGVMNTDNMTISGETIDYDRARLWMCTIQRRCLAPLIRKGGMRTVISRISLDGILHVWLKVFCRFCMIMRKKRLSLRKKR